MRKNLARSKSGSVVVIFALLTPIVMMSAAFSIDVGTFFVQKRALQNATDMAAIAAAQNPNNPLGAAQTNLTLNGFTSAAVQNVQLGTYTPDSTLAMTQRFVPGASGNAVQVMTQVQSPYYFATIFHFMSGLSSSCPTSGCTGTATSATASSATITATATAAINPQAAFAVASGLANLNGGIINSVLGGLLGSNVSFSLMDYQALASANVDLFAFSNALATRENLTAVTYNQLVGMQFQASDVFAALATAAQSSSSIALSTVSRLNYLTGIAPNTTISIAPLISFGAYGALKVNSPEPITATADALDMASAIAQLANGTHQVQVALSLNAPPLVSASLALNIGQRPVGTSFVSIGTTGATAHTAQTRLLLTFQIAQVGSSSLVSLPLYVELASATAQVTSISCGATPSQSTVTLGVTPAVVNAWIGAVSNSDMSNFSAEPNPGPATLLTLPGIATVSGRANATITNLSATPVTFTYADMLDNARKTTSTTDFVSSLLYNLFANLQMNVTLLGLNLSLPSNLTATVATTLATATIPIDQTLDQVLDPLGLSVGNAYTWVSDAKCGVAKLAM